MFFWILIFLMFTNFTQPFAGIVSNRKIPEAGDDSKIEKNTRHRRQSFDDNETWDDDILIFDNGDLSSQRINPRQVFFEQSTPSPPTVSTVEIPGMGTRRPLCEETCPSTPEYNPVCGDDNVTYPNIGKLQCAARCGRRVNLEFRGACLARARGR